MQKAIKVLFYGTLVAFACFLAGLTLYVLDQRFPATIPSNAFAPEEIFKCTPEGVDLMKVGVILFVPSSMTLLILSVIQRFRKPGSSA